MAAVSLTNCKDDGGGGSAGMGAAGTAAAGTGLAGAAAGMAGTNAATGGTGVAGTTATGGTGGTSAGTGGTGAAGTMATGGTGGTSLTCSADVMGDHTHPLTVPGSDVEQSFQEAPYILEDGGTGHTHTLELSAYDFAYLQAGATATVPSSETNAHTHQCVITCTSA